jgi:hypothetical protein
MRTPWEWWDYHTWSTAWGVLPDLTGFGRYDLWQVLLLGLATTGLLASLRGSGLTWRDGVFLLFGPAAAALSLASFDLIGNHAYSAHETQVQLLYTRDFPDGGLTPLEVPSLLRLTYLAVGARFSGDGPFVATALTLGSGGVVFLGAAVRLLTGRMALGLLAAALLTLHPSLTYWRGHAYGVAFSHTLICATILGAVLAGRKRSFWAYLAWFCLGGLSVVMRVDLAGAVFATTAIPLAVAGVDALRAWRRWVPALALAAGFTVPILVIHYVLMDKIEDFIVAGYLARLHLQIPEFFLPLMHPAMLVLLGGAVWAATRGTDEDLRRGARALWPMIALGLVPVLAFIDFGPRHTLPLQSAAAGLAAIGAAQLASWDRLPRFVGPGIVAALVALVGWTEYGEIRALSPRYGTISSTMPTLPDTPPPTTRALPEGWKDCALYSDHYKVCERAPNCHPSKDLRDPGAVGRRWDAHDGCVLWTISAYDYWVTGARHERWLAIRRHYPSEPVARLPKGPEDRSELHMYRMKERPDVYIEARGANRRPGE